MGRRKILYKRYPLFLDKEQYEYIHQIAIVKKDSINNLIRDLIEADLKKFKRKSLEESKDDEKSQ